MQVLGRMAEVESRVAEMWNQGTQGRGKIKASFYFGYMYIPGLRGGVLIHRASSVVRS